MNMRIARVLLIALSFLIGGKSAVSEVSESQENQLYSVSSEGQSGFKVKDLRQSINWDFAVPNLKNSWRLIPAGKLLSYEISSGAVHHWCLLDLSTRSKVCGASFSREENETPWSPSGKWVAWKSADLTVAHFALAESFSLEEASMPKADFSVQGHPLGLIWQQEWLSESEILLGTGVGESMCFGVADLDRRRFYSLTCLDSSHEDWGREAEVWLEKSAILRNRAIWRVVDEKRYPWTDPSQAK